MSELLKRLSTVFFGCNYLGVLYGALTFSTETNEEKKKLFLRTALKHAVFMSNNYLIHSTNMHFRVARSNSQSCF